MGSILNLVFDKWDDNGNPIANLSEINEQIGGEYIIDLHLLLNLPNPLIKINKCNLSDIQLSENYYYMIAHRCSFESMFNSDGWSINKDVEEYIKNKNLKIVFLSEHESYKDLKTSLINLITLLDKKGLNHNQFYIVNNNSLLYDLKKELNTNINVYKINFLLESVSNSITIKTSEPEIQTDKKFIFLCQNRRPKNHRLALLTLLKNKNLLKDDTIDWSLTYGSMNQSMPELTKYQFYIDFDNLQLFNDYKEICANSKLSFYEKNVDWWNSVDNYHPWNHLDLQTFNQSYINITTESHFDIQDIHITEKTFKPFYYFQIPLFLASYQHINKLKKEHDLYLFEDLIDHSYDNEKNDKIRMNMVVDEILRLSNIKSDIEIYYKSNIDKLIHNHNYIKDFYLKNETNLYFLNLTKKQSLNLI
jgi:hypothetical protein